MNMSLKTLFVLCLCFSPIWAQFYEDRRCRCICPSLASVLNNSQSLDRRFYTDNVPPSKCNCDGVIIPKVGSEIKGHEQEFCPRCECKYETRNTTVIMSFLLYFHLSVNLNVLEVVVIMVLWVLTLLSVYMGFMICLDPLINKQRVKFYQERGTEEACNLLLQGDDPED